MTEGPCSVKMNLPLKKRAMKKQFSNTSLKTENGETVDNPSKRQNFDKNSVDSAREEMETKRKAGITVNKRILEAEDSEAFDNIMQKQLEIVEGTEKFYQRIDRSLREGEVEPFFVKEQWDLYAWREKFFNDNFPPGSWFTDSEDTNSETSVIPMQITRNFTQIMKMASSTEEREEGEQHYLEHDRLASIRAYDRFSRIAIKQQLEEREQTLRCWVEREPTLTFSQIAHMIVEFHQDGLSLVFGCEEKKECDKLKEMLKQGKAGEDIPPELREKAVEGWYDISNQPPKFLTGEGIKIFNEVKAIFSKDKKVKTERKEKVTKKVKL